MTLFRTLCLACCGATLPLFASDAPQSGFMEAAEQRFAKAPVLCKVAVYRHTVTQNMIGDVRPDGKALISTTVRWEGVILQSYKGRCRQGDFIAFQTGGVEPGAPPVGGKETSDIHKIFFIEASDVQPASDGKFELVDAERVPDIPREIVAALRAVLKEKGFQP